MPEPIFGVGNEVRLRSRPDRAGKITGSPQCLQGEYWYPVFFGPGQSGRHPESDLEGYTQTFDTMQLLRDGRFAGREAFAKRLTYLKLARSLRSHVYALQASRTTFYPYQFKPVLKFLDSWKHRLRPDVLREPVVRPRGGYRYWSWEACPTTSGWGRSSRFHGEVPGTPGQRPRSVDSRRQGRRDTDSALAIDRENDGSAGRSARGFQEF